MILVFSSCSSHAPVLYGSMDGKSQTSSIFPQPLTLYAICLMPSSTWPNHRVLGRLMDLLV